MYNENITYQNLCISKNIYSPKCLYWKIRFKKKLLPKILPERKIIVTPK